MDLFTSQQSLSDAILAYRKPGTNHTLYLSQLLSEVRKELKSRDFSVKLVAA